MGSGIEKIQVKIHLLLIIARATISLGFSNLEGQRKLEVIVQHLKEPKILVLMVHQNALSLHI